MLKKSLPAIVWREGAWFVAKTLGVEVASQGRSKEEALQNLEEALDLYFEEESAEVPAASFLNNLQFKNLELTRINV